MKERVREHSREFDDFTYRIGTKGAIGYAELLSGPTKTYLRAAEAYLNDILFQKKAADRAGRNTGQVQPPTPSKGKWQGSRRS